MLQARSGLLMSRTVQDSQSSRHTRREAALLTRTIVGDLPLDAGDLGRRVPGPTVRPVPLATDFWYVRIDIRIPSRIGLSSNNSTLWESVTEDSGGKERAEREDGEGKHDERLKE